MNKQSQNLIIVAVIAVIVLLLFGGKMYVKLEATQRGVIFRQFGEGLDKDNTFEPGFHIIAPWNDMYVFEVKEETITETMDVRDKTGQSLDIAVTVRFHPNHDSVGYLYDKVKLDYKNTLVKPEVQAAVRQVAGKYTAEEIYSTKRNEIEQEIINEAGSKLKANFVEMKTLLISAIKLAPKIQKAIEDKLEQEQAAKAYEYRLEKETSEAQRKKIAAEGEAIANKIINSSLTDELLKMRGIEATLELSKSTNSKTIIIGGGKDGLPLIMNAGN